MISSIRVDPSGGLGIVTDTKERQIPYAMQLALNWTANDAQDAEQYRLKSGFKLQREAFNLRGIYIDNKDRATKKDWSVTIQVQASRDYLDKMEDGGYKLPTHGRWIWKPNPDVFKGKVIPAKLRPSALNFQSVGKNLIGDQRTFMVKAKNNQNLVLQRVDAGLAKGSKRIMGKITLDNFKGGMGPRTKREKYTLSRTAGTRMLYQLVDRVSVPMKLEFVDTVTQTVTAVWPARFQEAMDKAMDTAR